MSTCKKLADRYAAQNTARAIPDKDDAHQKRADWLYKSQWGCIPPGETKFYPDTNPLGNWPPTGTCYEKNDNPPPSISSKTTDGLSAIGKRPPVLNKLKEDGFLAWVNERSMKCINKITGKFYGLNPQTGLVNAPGVETPNPPVHCAGACQAVDFNSTMCFECIAHVLEDDPTQCPELSAETDVRELMAEGLSCLSCIGNQSGFIAKADQSADDEAMLNKAYQCITSTVSTGLSLEIILAIVIVSVMVLTVIITLLVYFLHIAPRIKKQKVERQALIARGVNPDDL